ncbi:MAG: LysM peptidoglycan-binding domain-containing protein [Fibromonadaceae bacterium]|jgi:LysM repeat protein|nr:LysM peptidoglycan-binding domain-containing protein [Fibromonadaceae bacterium]
MINLMSGYGVLFGLVIAVNLHGETLEHDMQIFNVSHLYPFFEKLSKLEKDTTAGKVNIVHIGDSHIQSDFLGSTMRKTLQQSFGNGGYGFAFPYGFHREGDSSRTFRFYSNASWRICRNNMPHRCDPDAEFGLAGYGFTASIDDFAMKIEVADEQYKFNTIKVVSAGTPFPYRPASAAAGTVIKNPPRSLERHTVKRGETLASIAKKYNVSADSIKDRNNMTSNAIRVGRILRVPVEVESLNIDMSLFSPLEFQQRGQHVAAYRQKEPALEAYLIPAVKLPLYNLNGLVFESDERGVIYHSIGTVGSMASHFNATPLFFEQLPVLSPDLVIISFGTNESFNKVPTKSFIEQINLLIANIRKNSPNVPVIVTTPPTSLFKGGALNTYAEEYSNTLLQASDFAVWDLYSFTGGLMGAKENPEAIQIERDRMHYTEQGYNRQGTVFANVILHNYEAYKQLGKEP